VTSNDLEQHTYGHYLAATAVLSPIVLKFDMLMNLRSAKPQNGKPSYSQIYGRVCGYIALHI